MLHLQTALTALVVVLLGIVAVPVASAGSSGSTCRVRNVTQDTDGDSVKTMVAAAQDGDRLRVRGTCIGAVVIDRDLTIVGVGTAAKLSGDGRVRVVRVRAGAIVTLAGLIISDGAARHGGGILNAGTLTLVHVKVRNNRAGPDDPCGLRPDPTCGYRRGSRNVGGGIVNTGTLDMVASRVWGNRAANGGGIANDGTMTVTRSTIARNVAAQWGESWGGGIINAGTLTIRRSTIAKNAVVSGEGYAGGGGIVNGGRLIVTESTISHNRVRGQNGGTGGGIANGFEYGCCGAGEVLLAASTVTGNETGGIYACLDCEEGSPDTMTLRSSIVAGNGRDCVGTFASAGHNLIGMSGRSCEGFRHGVEHDRVGSAADPISPRLGPLADNGGSTLTHALRPGSPAIDHAGPGPCDTRYDQRGARRPQGVRCDIGALERRTAR